MTKRIYIFLLLLISFSIGCFSQKNTTTIPIQEDEKWWGGAVALGAEMPFGKQLNLIDLSTTNLNNQVIPLLLSSDGRYIWSKSPFQFSIKNNVILLNSDSREINVTQSGKTLKDAYLEASGKYFAPSGRIPDSLFFTQPTYNTWIELTYNQNQKDILNYANQILKNNFPAGILMIDDNWQKYYGNFEFKPDKFSNPKAMVDKLHKQGFKVMLWVCPFVSADSPEFRWLQEKGFLIKQKGTNKAAIISWWNGNSACLDLTNANAFDYIKNKLQAVQKDYGINGFKFDAGDIEHYVGDLDFFDNKATSVTLSERWAQLGLDFPFNEYRACWKMGGEALVQRLGDKPYSWDAIQLLIPQMLTAGLMGHAYTCPDMIGGGEFTSFMNVDQTKLDQALILRSAQIHALMPMMQFSVAPWRILSAGNLAICRKYAYLHQKFGKYILQLAKESSKTGEPIVRLMEYAYPHQGFSICKDEFMLGDKYLVAPVLNKNNTREIKLPKGNWRDDEGKVIKGDTIFTVNAGLERLPYYERMD